LSTLKQNNIVWGIVEWGLYFGKTWKPLYHHVCTFTYSIHNLWICFNIPLHQISCVRLHFFLRSFNIIAIHVGNACHYTTCILLGVELHIAAAYIPVYFWYQQWLYLCLLVTGALLLICHLWYALREGSFTGEPEIWGFWEMCKMPCKQASLSIRALLGNLERVRLPGLLREMNSISEYLSWT